MDNMYVIFTGMMALIFMLSLLVLLSTVLKENKKLRCKEDEFHVVESDIQYLKRKEDECHVLLELLLVTKNKKEKKMLIDNFRNNI